MNGTPASSQIIWLENKVKEQADEIERLRENLSLAYDVFESCKAEIEWLREALKKIADNPECLCGQKEMQSFARAALKGDE